MSKYIKYRTYTDSVGTKYWVSHENNRLHRPNGKPAVVYKDDPIAKQYWFKGKSHNVYGPAVITNPSHHEGWYIHGILYTKDEWIKEVKNHVSKKTYFLLRLKYG